jgi:parvulin-like peptidyl-prolyl isomerase
MSEFPRRKIASYLWNCSLLNLLFCIFLASFAFAAEGDSPAAAFVGEVPIAVAEVNRTLKTALQGREVPPAALAVLQAQALEQLIGRKLIQQRMAREKTAPAAHEIEQALEAMQAKLKEQNVPWETLLAQRGLKEADARAEIAWEIGWKKYLQKQVTDAALEAYFQAHRREYDGSQLQVSHILLRPANSTPAAQAETLKQAEEIREKLIAKKLTFAEAAQAYSAGPSRDHGGDLGFIPRQGLMDEAFSRAAFALELGEISPPVRTRFGIHLIRATQLQAGTKSVADVREQLLQPLALELFQKLSQEERQKVPVRYTGTLPHFQPGTQQVVLPSGK